VLRHFHVANQPFLKAISFVVGRYPNSLGLTGGTERINGNANPACILYELWTAGGPDDPMHPWGMRKPASQIDVDQLRAVGNVLADEALGLSFTFDGVTTAEELFEEILRHIDAEKYDDPVTGKLVIKLIRQDYEVEDLLQLTDEDFELDPESSGRPVWGATKNAINLTYEDRSWNFTERGIPIEDTASVDARGETVVEDVHYPGYTDFETASAQAFRILRTLSSRPYAAVGTANRKAHLLRPGTPFLWSSNKEGIQGMPMRVGTVEPGDPRDGKIHLEAREDIWAPIFATFTSPGSAPPDPVLSGGGGFGESFGESFGG
jgi:hypothetical protein